MTSIGTINLKKGILRSPEMRSETGVEKKRSSSFLITKPLTEAAIQAIKATQSDSKDKKIENVSEYHDCRDCAPWIGAPEPQVNDETKKENEQPKKWDAEWFGLSPTC
ncbi:MAG: hypothetical protein QXW70_01205 [Candidatus Anstonellales archaeon]